MPLYAILHIDFEGLHPSSCKVIAASSELEVAQSILENPDRWRAALLYCTPDDGDERSLWQRVQSDELSPEALLELINQTSLDLGCGEMLRIVPVEVESLNSFVFEARWSQETNIMPTRATFLSSKVNQLSLLKPLITQDTRSLLATENFQQYLQTLFKQNIWRYSSLPLLERIEQNPLTWLLPRLKFPLKLSSLKQELLPASNQKSTAILQHLSLDIELGLWRSHLEIPLGDESPVSDEVGPEDLELRWLNVAACLKRVIEANGFVISLELTSDEQAKIILELTCLIAFVVESAATDLLMQIR